MSGKNDDWELEELDLDKEPEEPEYYWDEPDDWPEEPETLKPGAILLIFLGMLVLAAIITGILWNVTHRDKEAEDSAQYTAEMPEESDEPEGQGAAVSSSVETGSSSETDGQEESEPSFEETGAAEESDSEEAVSPASEATEDDGQEASEFSAGEEVSAAEPSLPEETAEAAPEPADTTETAATETDDANRVTTQDGRVIVFTDCDDIVSPKEYVNLRLEPSTSQGNSTVRGRLNYGETVHRTGISEDSGWSRVEIDGVISYVVTSFVYVVE